LITSPCSGNAYLLQINAATHVKLSEDQGASPNSRFMDNLFLNRVITPEADKTRGKGS